MFKFIHVLLMICIWPGALASVPATSDSLAVQSALEDSGPMIAIIIDDLGNQKLAGERTVALPGPVVCAVMPHTTYSSYLADQAHAAGKEVLLHLPMQGMDMDRFAGPGEIGLDTTRSSLSLILESDLRDVPHVAGINNHMGSLVTRHPGHMAWLMDEILAHGDLFFIDSYTTAASIAYETAVEKGIPAARRNIFLDHVESEEAIARQFERLKAEARRSGYAIGIGHPHDTTLRFLQRVLPLLDQQGFSFVPVSRIVEHQTMLNAPLRVAEPDAVRSRMEPS